MTQLPAHLLNRSSRAITPAVSAGLGQSSPPYVSIKGGAFTLVDSAGEQDPVETKHLDCVIVDTHESVAIQRVFWGKDRPFDPNSDAYQPPVCFSDNGVGASVNSQEPQSQNCQTCQWNVWGSATSRVSGKGVKACGAIKKVAVVPVEGAVNNEGVYANTWLAEFPFLLRVPIMSHENLRVYADKFKGQSFDVSDIVTRVSFVHGAVGVLDFQAVGFIDPETVKLREEVAKSGKTDALVGRGDVPWRGQAGGKLQGTTQQQLPPAGSEAGRTAAQVEHKPEPQPEQKEQSAPARRGRRKAADAPAAPPPSSDAGAIPPFLQRAPLPEMKGNAGAPFGIATSAPPPNPELASALDKVFGLKT